MTDNAQLLSRQVRKDNADSPESALLSTRATSTSGSIIRPLLKVSPPTPHGSTPGRYKVTLRRATVAQPLGLAIEQSSTTRKILIGEDEDRVGLRKGDEVLRINKRAVKNMEEARVLLAAALHVELELQHHEQGSTQTAGCEILEGVGCEMPACRFLCCGERQVHQPQHSMRQLLSTSGPVLTEGQVFAVQIVRASLIQPFGLVFVDGPDEALLVKEDLPQYGLQAGDRVLNINSQSDLNNTQAQAILEDKMNVWLECRRDEQSAVVITEALQIEDIDVDMSKPGVCCEGFVMQDVPKTLSGGGQSTGIKGFFSSIFQQCSCQGIAEQERSYTIQTDVQLRERLTV